MTSGRRSLLLTAGAGVVALQALVLVLCAVLVLAETGGGLAALGVSTAVFFVVCAAALLACAWGLYARHSWARAPIVLTQLITLGLAWDARHATTVLAVVLAVLALLGLGCILHPASIAALEPENPDHE